MIKLASVLLFFATFAFSQQARNPSGILPDSFSGWKIEPPGVKTSSDPAVADSADAAVLHEYGFADSVAATYIRNDRKMQIKAARFADAGGAYGAFTYYVHPQMRVEKIGDKAASNNTRILFYQGNILVDAVLEHITAMSGADLRALADALPRPKGNQAALPTLPANLPAQSLLPNTTRYVAGPVALGRLGLPLSAELVDFSKSPEVASGKYKSSEGEANLTIVGYPTPQIARERITTMQTLSLPGGPFYFKRTGPFVVAVNGSIPADEAQSLLASVNYDAEITWNQPTKLKPSEDRAGFVVALIMLCVLAILGALVFGFAFGGLRVVITRFFPNKVFKRPEEEEMIRLDLK